MIISSFMEFL